MILKINLGKNISRKNLKYKNSQLRSRYFGQHILIFENYCFDIYLIFCKRHEEISQVKMFNLNLWKNKSYYMNFIHKNMSYMPL